MRMWGVDPTLLCDKHLGGEHVEMHMAAGTVLREEVARLSGVPKKGWRLAWFTAERDNKGVTTSLLAVHLIRSRHDALAAEMLRRGMRHLSPLPEFPVWEEGTINSADNLQELARRCVKCAARQQQSS